MRTNRVSFSVNQMHEFASERETKRKKFSDSISYLSTITWAMLPSNIFIHFYSIFLFSFVFKKKIKTKISMHLFHLIWFRFEKELMMIEIHFLLCSFDTI